MSVCARARAVAILHVAEVFPRSTNGPPHAIAARMVDRYTSLDRRLTTRCLRRMHIFCFWHVLRVRHCPGKQKTANCKTGAEIRM
jgi:hypothetical protein